MVTAAISRDAIIELLEAYLKVLQENGITIKEAILFGSYARGNPRKESDIDVALVSDSFTGDWFDDRRRIVPFRRKIDSRIEPMPFRPEDFFNGGGFVDEIKRTGKRLDFREK